MDLVRDRRPRRPSRRRRSSAGAARSRRASARSLPHHGVAGRGAARPGASRRAELAAVAQALAFVPPRTRASTRRTTFAWGRPSASARTGAGSTKARLVELLASVLVEHPRLALLGALLRVRACAAVAPPVRARISSTSRLAAASWIAGASFAGACARASVVRGGAAALVAAVASGAVVAVSEGERRAKRSARSAAPSTRPMAPAAGPLRHRRAPRAASPSRATSAVVVEAALSGSGAVAVRGSIAAAALSGPGAVAARESKEASARATSSARARRSARAIRVTHSPTSRAVATPVASSAMAISRAVA